MSAVDARRDVRRSREARYAARALLIWPRLDRDRLRRTGDDPVKIARLVARRTTLSVEEILALLVNAPRE